MPHFDILRQSKITDSFRVNAVKSIFDISEDKIIERFTGNIDIENKEWNIGIIYGSSGSGKSTIAKELFPEHYICSFKYLSETVIDDMPEDADIKTITNTFNSVGFSSPPSWLKPYSVLSNGEKMRINLARALLEKKDLIVFDEFTSVVNREVAKIGSIAVQKAIRKMNCKFIAVSCHEDIIDFLEPDWIYNTNTNSFFLAENIKDRQSKLISINAKEMYGELLSGITI